MSTCACPPRAFGATAFVGTLVCHQWNSCGWQVPGRQQQTGAEHAWLTDASAYSLRGREGQEQGPLLHLNSLAPPLLLGLILSHSLYLTVSLLPPPVSIWGICCCHCLLSIYIFLILPLFSSSLSPNASIWWFWPEPKPLLCSFLTSLHLPALPPLMDSWVLCEDG